jgi:hypothetical protein
MKRIMLLLVMLFALFGCEVEQVSFDDVSKFKNKVQYFTDFRGNCFAMVGIRATGSVSMSGIGFTLVPLENCVSKE